MKLFTGNNSTAIGCNSVVGGSGGGVTAVGYSSANNIGNTSFVTAIGGYSFGQATVGSHYNTGIGYESGYNITSGTKNTFIGYVAGYTDGAYATTATVSGSTAIGCGAQVTQNSAMVFGGSGCNNVRVGINMQAPASYFHLPAGTSSEGFSPMKFQSGSLLTTPESGSIEFDGNNLYFTSGSIRENMITAYSASAPANALTASIWLAVNYSGSSYRLPLYQ